MHHALIVGSRVVAGLAGALAFYFAFFLYENEQGIWQNRLENLWVALDDRAKLTNSKATALFNKIAEIQEAVYNRVFGSGLDSARTEGVSTSLSIGGMWFFSTLIYRESASGVLIGMIRSPLIANHALLLGFACLCVAFIPACYPRKWATWITFIPAIWFSFYIIQDLIEPNSLLDRYLHLLPLALLASTASDFVVVVALRKSFAWISESISLLRTLSATVALTILSFIILLFPQIILRLIYPNLNGAGNPAVMFSDKDVADATTFLNVSTSILCLIPVLMLIVVVANRLLWPILGRAFLPFARYDVVKNKKVLVAFGTLCLTFAFNLEHVGAKELLKLLS